MGLLTAYRKWRMKHNEKENKVQCQIIQDEIRIVLKNKSIWITVSGEAVYKVQPDETAESIVKKAEEVYNTAKRI